MISHFESIVHYKILSVAYVTLLGHDVLFQDGKFLLLRKTRYHLQMHTHEKL